MQCNLVDSFFQVMDAMTDEQKAPKDYGTGSLLYHSELSLMEAINNYPDTNISELSKKIKVTKGAVTQVANKLLAKELIESYTIKGNKKQKYLRLTGKGNAAIDAHQEYHRAANQKLCNYFRNLSEDEAVIIYKFLDTMKECAPVCAFTCTCKAGTNTMEEGADYEQYIEHQKSTCWNR